MTSSELLFCRRDVHPVPASKHLTDSQLGRSRLRRKSSGSDRHSSTPGLPRVFDHNIELANNHLSYAITWFSLAAAVAGGFVYYAVGRLRER